MSMINFMLSWVEHEKSFITTGPVLPSVYKYYMNYAHNLDLKIGNPVIS